jgi:hypothetical protein
MPLSTVILPLVFPTGVGENQATESHHHTDHHLKISNKSKPEYTNTQQDLTVG